ncbi:MAG: class I SAM-dependent rRNA methyltransferase [Planctomycetota bacterium]
MENLDIGVRLGKGREHALRRRHPWIYSGGIDETVGDPEPGAVVAVVDSAGRCIARGLWNPNSQIAVRVLTWGSDAFDQDSWAARVATAVARRSDLAADPTTDAYRLVHSDADGLPGCIVDRYGDWLVLQLSSLGIERRCETIVDALVDEVQPRGVLLRVDEDMREKEQLTRVAGVLRGESPGDEFTICERGRRFHVDLIGGHKTGFYLDQRSNRDRVAAYAHDRDVLDAFCYSGGFTVAAGLGGAHRVVSVDSSAPALALARRNRAANDLPVRDEDHVDANVFEYLRGARDRRLSFDMIILDPPKLARSRHQLDSALRAYKDANLLGLKLLRGGGVLFTFSCSGAVSHDDFRKMLMHAAADAGRDVQIIETLAAGADHPTLATLPESEYLKGFVCRVS